MPPRDPEKSPEGPVASDGCCSCGSSSHVVGRMCCDGPVLTQPWWCGEVQPLFDSVPASRSEGLTVHSIGIFADAQLSTCTKAKVQVGSGLGADPGLCQQLRTFLASFLLFRHQVRSSVVLQARRSTTHMCFLYIHTHTHTHTSFKIDFKILGG